jgi:hypothetical protein
MRSVFRVSRWLHKYVGLVLLLYFLLEGSSGILLNHPNLIRDLSVPRSLVPRSYQLAAWNRSSLRSIVFSPRNPEVAYAWGSQGVWKSTDGGRTFAVMSSGFPESAYGRRTNDLLLMEGATDRLLAGTDAGLFSCDAHTGEWRSIALGRLREPVRNLLRVEDRIAVFTSSHAYESLPSADLTFREIRLQRIETDPGISLVLLFFELHNGETWGLPGRLLFDLAGLLMILLSLSGLYMWYFPWRRKRRKTRDRAAAGTSRRLYRFFVRYHLKLGIWIAVIFLIIGFTGMFMRPPLIMALVGKNVPKSLYPGPWPSNPWHHSIRTALYNPVDDTILIEARGFWRGPSDFSRPFEKVDFPISTFPMGANVFECDRDGNILVGSFSGISRLEHATGAIADLIADEPYNTESSGRFKFMVSGYFETPDGEAFVIGYKQGLKGIAGTRTQGRFAMPPEVVGRYRIPIWSFLFEMHNGRIFRDFIGGFYILVPLVGGLFFILSTLTGVYDWCFRRWSASTADPKAADRAGRSGSG